MATERAEAKAAKALAKAERVARAKAKAEAKAEAKTEAKTEAAPAVALRGDDVQRIAQELGVAPDKLNLLRNAAYAAGFHAGRGSVLRAHEWK